MSREQRFLFCESASPILAISKIMPPMSIPDPELWAAAAPWATGSAILLSTAITLVFWSLVFAASNRSHWNPKGKEVRHELQPEVHALSASPSFYQGSVDDGALLGSIAT